MKPRLLLCLALALSGSLPGCSTTTRHSRDSKAWGPVADGLQMSLSVSPAENSLDPVIEVAIGNMGERDVCLNLGMMLANGKEMFPSRIQLNLVDGSGNSRELHCIGPGAIAGRVDYYVVPLRIGAVYTLKLRLDQFWYTGSQEFAVKLKPGKYEISAQFQGTGAGTINSDMEGMRLMNFWKGKLQSNVAEILER